MAVGVVKAKKFMKIELHISLEPIPFPNYTEVILSLLRLHNSVSVYAEVFLGAMKEREAESGAEAKNNPVSADLDPVPLSLLKYLPC